LFFGGNINNQEVAYIDARDSRSWTLLHILNGDFYTDESGNKRSRCSGFKVHDSTFGPSGLPELDSQGQGQWSDGISLGCEQSEVTNNVITDTTDGGIVIFGSPGSLISGNTVRAVHRQAISGIVMVDYFQDGNLNNVRVTNNVVDAAGAYIRVGIGMGTSTYLCNYQDKPNRGGIVSNNRLTGNYMGYGFAISGVSNWTVEGNISEARHSGTFVHDTCNGRPTTPGSFLIQRNLSQGNFQGEFSDASLEGIFDVVGQSGNWVTPYCSGQKFSGCSVNGNARCTDYGGDYYPNWDSNSWNTCNSACNMPNPDNYCVPPALPPLPSPLPSPSPSPSPSPTPIVEPSPSPSPSPSPTTPPQIVLACTGITNNTSEPTVGQIVQLTCVGSVTPAGATSLSYEFRSRINQGSWQSLTAAGNKANLAINACGTYAAQCRVCGMIGGGKQCSPLWNSATN